MNPDRWELVAKILDAALDQPQSARNDFVRQGCKGDEELEAEVLRLLAADEQAGSFLERQPFPTTELSQPARTASLLNAGTTLAGRFKILRFIGQGGMGQVYEAIDLELNARVALKAIRPDISSDPRMISRFRREVQLTRRITHPNVCRTFDIERHSSTAADGSSSELIFLTMELLEGETLADFLRRQGRMTTAEAYPLVLQMIDALSAAHAAGVIHRDFKPPNVLLVSVDSVQASSSASHSNAPMIEHLRVVVTDFGLARAILPEGQVSAEHVATSLTGNQGLMGTLIYMAPEQFERGEATAASDIYSLGLVMYEMITGSRPFADIIPFAEAAKRLKQAAPSPKILVPELDPAWEAAIVRCLAIDAGIRFDTVRDLAQELTPGGEGSTHRSKRKSNWISAQLINPVKASAEMTIWWRVASLIIILFAVSLSAVVLRHYQVKSNAKLAGGSTVLLTEIQNSTGDKRFDNTTEVIRHQLFQSPYFNLMDTGRIREVLTQMKKPENAPLDPPTAREVAMRAGAPRVIFGAVSRVGDRYVLDLGIEQPDNNLRRARAQWENHWTWNMSSVSSDKEIPTAFLSAVRDGSDWIRSEVGESANDIARIDIPPQDVTTENWNALSEFAEAEKLNSAGRTEDSIIVLQNAVVADPHFALAYTRLADELVSLNRYDEGYRAYRNALAEESQQRITRREKDRLQGIYASDTEDFSTAEAAFRDYTVYYPNDYLGWFYRAYPLMMMGKVEEAITTLKRAVALNPTGMSAASHIARFNLILGNFEETSKWIQYLRDNHYVSDADFDEGEAKFLQGSYQEAQTSFSKLKDSKSTLYRTFYFSMMARLSAELGQYSVSTRFLEQGMALDIETGDTVHRVDKLLDRAYINFKRGNYTKCLQDIRQSLDLDRSLLRSLDASTLLGQAAYAAPLNERPEVAMELRRIEAEFPRGQFKPISEVARLRLRGEVLLAEGKWEGALDRFRTASRMEAPARDKEYLARGLLAAADYTHDRAMATNYRKSALAIYSTFASKPGQTWQWSLSSPPGYLSDELLDFAKTASLNGKADEPARAALKVYLSRRSHERCRKGQQTSVVSGFHEFNKIGEKNDQ